MSISKENEPYAAAYFNFNESAGNFIDSVKGVIGTTSNVNRSIGYAGNSASFNGTNSFVTLNKRIMPLGAKTMHFKIKTTANTGSIYSDVGGSANNGYNIQNINGKLSCILYNSVFGKYVFYITSSKLINDGKWHDIIINWDGTTSQNGVKMYIDYELEVEETAVSTEKNTSQYTGFFGKMQSNVGGPSNFYNGEIDEFEVYDRVLEPVDFVKIFSYLFSQNNTAYTIENNALKPLGTIRTANASTLFKSGVEAITKEHCVLVGQQLGKAKILKMSI